MSGRRPSRLGLSLEFVQLRGRGQSRLFVISVVSVLRTTGGRTGLGAVGSTGSRQFSLFGRWLVSAELRSCPGNSSVPRSRIGF